MKIKRSGGDRAAAASFNRARDGHGGRGTVASGSAMTREVGGRHRRSRTMTVLVTVTTLALGVLLAGTASAAQSGTASAAPSGTAAAAPAPAAPAEGAGGRTEGTPCSTEARACVDRAGRTAWLIRDGRIEAGPVRVSPGGQGRETPLGTFQVEWKNRDHRSTEFNGAPMPFAVFFAPGGIAFHEGNLDSPSAGCVRLDRANAERWFATLQVGDRVEVR
ncbi:MULTISPECIES: L,D-transpeptidase [Pseudonocardia]|uniref:L,D-transpeptidase n=1 Tax=Pseudonocardia TaxID=1847 RepID=UPI001E3DBF5A|nr:MULTISPECIES: L,D-transpeptidase [Pseudonocardia]